MSRSCACIPAIREQLSVLDRPVSSINVVYFFFQAEDGIRDYKVTGVQTCALPISRDGIDHRERFASLRAGQPHSRRLFVEGRDAALEICGEPVSDACGEYSARREVDRKSVV